MSREIVDYTATRDFTLAPPIPGSNPLKVKKGTSITFDGLSITYEHYVAQPLPTFLGAVRAGWVVKTEDYVPSENVVPRAPIHLSPAEGGNPLNPTPIARASRPAVRGDSVVARSASVTAGGATVSAGGMRVQGPKPFRPNVVVEDQGEAIIARTLRPANTRHGERVDLAYSEGVIRQADSVRIQPGRGLSREEYVWTLPMDERISYVESIRDKRPSRLAEIHARNNPMELQKYQEIIDREEETFKLCLKYETQPSPSALLDDEGAVSFKPKKSPGKKTGKAVKPAKPAAPVKATKPSLTKEVVAAPVVATGTVDPRRQVALAFCPDFPENYNYDLPVKQKMARLMADYYDRADIIKAVLASETDAAAKVALMQEFPHAFA